MNKSVFNKKLNNGELAAFALGLVVGAAGALTGVLSCQHSESRDAARAQPAYAETQEQWIEHECLPMVLARPRRVPDTDLPSDCSSVVAKLHASANTKLANQ
ncbi:hypothetical protein [Burkholderia ubonensis]|uniref:hypothetical protein n=1 Tax=Burkholderia ubonensis TaxID=101571 RepID=UPI000B1A5F88|nr:hypothetical protein [Burkholderia ubonensis]